jgi:hypothetical protein
MARTLTTKQAAYRDARVSGLGPADAYRKAYDASKMTAASIYANAQKLEKHTLIALSIAESLTEAVQVVEERRQEAVASAAWIIEQAVKVVEFGMATVPVRGRDGKVIEQHFTDEDGNESVEPAFYEAANLPAVNGALKLLAQRHPEFRDASPVVEVKVLVVGESKL